jgi:hypothetical protein
MEKSAEVIVPKGNEPKALGGLTNREGLNKKKRQLLKTK